MGIENLLAQGVQIRPAGMERNALMQYQQFQDAKQRNALMQMQLQGAIEQQAQARQAAQQQAQWRNSLEVPQGQQVMQPGRPAMNAAQAESAVSTPGYGMSSAQDQMRTMPADPRMVQAVQMAKAGQMSPQDLFKIQNPEPMKLGKDDRLLQAGPGGSFRELVGAASEKADKEPEDVRLLKLVYGDGTPEYRQAMQMLARKKTTHQPAVSVSVGSEKALAAGLGKQAAEAVDKSASDSQAAQATQSIIGNIRSAMSKGEVLLGPTAALRQGALRVGQIIGAGSTGSADTLARTKEVEQGLAGLELEAAALMKGQGQITESERSIIRKAAAGQIQDLTPKELEVALAAIERNAQRKIKSHEQRIKALPAGAAPGMRDLLSPAPASAGSVTVNWGDMK